LKSVLFHFFLYKYLFGFIGFIWFLLTLGPTYLSNSVWIQKFRSEIQYFSFSFCCYHLFWKLPLVHNINFFWLYFWNGFESMFSNRLRSYFKNHQRSAVAAFTSSLFWAHLELIESSRYYHEFFWDTNLRLYAVFLRSVSCNLYVCSCC